MHKRILQTAIVAVLLQGCSEDQMGKAKPREPQNPVPAVDRTPEVKNLNAVLEEQNEARKLMFGFVGNVEGSSANQKLQNMKALLEAGGCSLGESDPGDFPGEGFDKGWSHVYDIDSAQCPLKLNLTWELTLHKDADEKVLDLGWDFRNRSRTYFELNPLNRVSAAGQIVSKKVGGGRRVDGRYLVGTLDVAGVNYECDMVLDYKARAGRGSGSVTLSLNQRGGWTVGAKILIDARSGNPQLTYQMNGKTVEAKEFNTMFSAFPVMEMVYFALAMD